MVLIPPIHEDHVPQSENRAFEGGFYTIYASGKWESDFAAYATRIKALIDGPTRREEVNAKRPYNLELRDWMGTHMVSEDDAESKVLFRAAVLVFTALLGISEISNVRTDGLTIEAIGKGG